MLWNRAHDEGGDPKGARLQAVSVLGPGDSPSMHARIGETIHVRVYFNAPPDENGHIVITIKNRFNQTVTVSGTRQIGLGACSSVGGFGVLDLSIDLMLEAGLYSFMISYGIPNRANGGQRIDDTGWLGPIQVSWDYETDVAPFLGLFGLPIRGHYEAGGIDL